MTPRWQGVVEAATAHDAAARVPFHVGDQPVGSVARAHLAALRTLGEPALEIGADGVRLTTLPERRSAALAGLNRRLHALGVVRGWRDETYAVVTDIGAEPLALIERAAARFWGTLCLGAHANGYVADAAGRPQRLWIARRAATKATDPGLLDNLVGGGVPWGESPRDALLREGGEEAGLPAAVMACAVEAGTVDLHRDVPEGLQRERIVVFDLALPPTMQPVNRDGEVAEFQLLDIDAALRLAASGAMTVDAALVTLDFARRHLAPAA